MAGVAPLPVAAVAPAVPAVQKDEQAAPGVPPPAAGSITRPAVPSTVSEYFMPNDRTLAEALQAENQSVPDGTPAPIIFTARPWSPRRTCATWRVNATWTRSRCARCWCRRLNRRGIVRWNDFHNSPLDEKQVLVNGLPQARFASLEDPLGNAKVLSGLQKDFADWVYRTGQVHLQANESLKVYAGPETAPCRLPRVHAARPPIPEGRLRWAKLSATYDAKLEALKSKLADAARDISQREEKTFSGEWKR